MKVVVAVESQFVVDLPDVHDENIARRAVEANWDSIYKHRAKWLDGTAPQLNGTLKSIVRVER